MEAILFIIAIIVFAIAAITIARLNKKLKAETAEANRLRTEMLRAQNNVILCEQEIEKLKKELEENKQKGIEYPNFDESQGTAYIRVSI